jgi:hypothetical protein
MTGDDATGIIGGFLRTGHGSQRGKIHVEVPPIDELPDPVKPLPGSGPETAGPIERNPDGTVSGSEAAKALGKRGGEAKAKRARLIDALGLSKLVEGAKFAPYRTAAEEFTKHHLAELADSAGGYVGASASSMVASAAIQLGASRYLFDQASESGDPAVFMSASKLADSSRQHLIAAYALAVRAAEIRAKNQPPVSPMESIRRRVASQDSEEGVEAVDGKRKALAARSVGQP